MTLKAHAVELSLRAKAFSIESLLSEKNKGNVEGFEKNSKDNSKALEKGNKIAVELCCSDLWEKFNRLQTEMVVTRAGRRMFPTLKLRLKGLTMSINYIVYLDISLVEATKYRYNYQRSEWAIVGPSKNDTSSNIYIHPDSPAKGEVWMSRSQITFDKIKLTNYRRPFVKDQVFLNSMHRYQPKIHVLEVSENEAGELDSRNVLDYVRKNSERAATFVFEQTAFMAVTAYQNQEITRLKIQSNPFAKGFRQVHRAKKDKRSIATAPPQLATNCRQIVPIIPANHNWPGVIPD